MTSAEHRDQAQAHADVARLFLDQRDYSRAATECHRAYQQTLMANVAAEYEARA